jgi:hypothetical protein
MRRQLGFFLNDLFVVGWGGVAVDVKWANQQLVGEPGLLGQLSPTSTRLNFRADKNHVFCLYNEYNFGIAKVSIFLCFFYLQSRKASCGPDWSQFKICCKTLYKLFLWKRYCIKCCTSGVVDPQLFFCFRIRILIHFPQSFGSRSYLTWTKFRIRTKKFFISKC